MNVIIDSFKIIATIIIFVMVVSAINNVFPLV